jgi:hypothetical protein
MRVSVGLNLLTYCLLAASAGSCTDFGDREWCTSGFDVELNKEEISQTYKEKGWGEFTKEQVFIKHIVKQEFGDYQYQYEVVGTSFKGRAIGNNCGTYDIVRSVK